MLTCEYCGQHLKEDATTCPHCGRRQHRQELDSPKKPCKKCHQAIPINANFCPYCGVDQAILIYDPSREEQVTASIKAEQNDVMSFEDEFEELKEAIENPGEEISDPVNETGQPGLLASTKLMIKDMFKVHKRMGRADFWWGYLGILILSFFGFALLQLFYPFVMQKFPNYVGAYMYFGLTINIAFYLVTTFTATLRRYHDAKVPTPVILVRFMPFCGELFALFFALRPQNNENNKYTFKDPNSK